MRLPFSVLLALSVLASCRVPEERTAATASSSADSVAIQSLSRAFDSLLTASQAEPFLALLTADVAWMIPNQPTLNGVEAVRGRLRWRSNTSKLDLVTTIEEIQVGGSWAHMKGSYRMRITPLAGGSAVVEQGKVINILRQTDGGVWKVARHIWNVNHADQ